MHPYLDTPYFVHGMTMDRFGYQHPKQTSFGAWRNVPGQPMRFYHHRGPYHPIPRAFTPKPSYHPNARMSAAIAKKHKSAFKRREYRQSTAAGNYGMQARRQAAGLNDGLLVERNFPKDFQAILKAEFAKRRKIEEQQTAAEFRETAEAAAAAQGDTPDAVPQQGTDERPYYRPAEMGDLQIAVDRKRPRTD